jgi:hypothetical protein
MLSLAARATVLTGGHPGAAARRAVTVAAGAFADATVSGDGTYRLSDGAVRCRLTVTAGGRRFGVSVSWSQRSRFARARLGHAVLSLPAP